MIALVFGCGTSTTLSQEEWKGKPYAEWSREDVRKVMNESSWVVTHEVRIRQAPQTRRVAGAPVANPAGVVLGPENNTATVGGADIPIDFIFTLRLRSGLPVRQALVRQRQFDAGHDEMRSTERAVFDANTKGLLECPACAENYVVTLSARSKNSPGADAVFTVFKGARLAELKRYVFIANDRGERRDLVHFVPPKTPGDEAIFFFSRYDIEGKPLLTVENREFTINFTDNQVNPITNFKIAVSSLVINGEVLF